MGTTSSATSAASTAASSYFTGSSAFSSSLQNAIAQAVEFASVPLTGLTNQQTTLTNQSDEVTTLNTKFSTLQADVAAIDSALSSSFNTTISDPSVVSATVGQGATNGNYSIQVNSAGSYSTMMTSTWNDASGSAQTYKLYIGNQEYDVTPTDNSASSVVAAINSQYGSEVQASVVNVGTNESPDDRIWIQTNSLTTDTVDLQDGSGNDLAAQQTPGAAAQYEIDGSGNVVSGDSPNVDIAPGVTLTLLAPSDGAVNVTVTQSTSALSSALSQFATDYNAAVTEVDNNRGQAGGALQGQPIVNQLQEALESIATYNVSGSGIGLTDLGLTLGENGQFTFDAMQLAATALTNPSGLDSFLGSAPDTSTGATGSGFLQLATNTMNGIEDSSTGLLPTTETQMQTQLTNLASQITDDQNQVDNLQTQLTTQMSTADASISTMEQQYSYLSQMFQAEEVNEQETAGV